MWDGWKKPNNWQLPSWTPKALILGECLLLFLVLYLSTNYLNSIRSFHFNAYFNWELHIPLVPEMMIFYASLYLVPFALPWLLRPGELVPCARAVKFSLYLSVPIFLLFPTELGWDRQLPHSIFWDPIYNYIYTVDYPHNLVPSYHVVLATLVFMPLIRNCWGSSKAYFYMLFMAFVDVSILFVHQHHLLDLFTGLALGLYAYNKVYLKQVELLEKRGVLLGMPSKITEAKKRRAS